METIRHISPLPYSYTEETNWNDQVNSLITQVAEFCGTEIPEGKTLVTTTSMDPITGMNTTHKYYKEVYEFNKSYWAKLWQVIRFISNLTCWTDQADDTFLMQTRVQYYDVAQRCGCKPGCCHCDENIISIPLDYSPTAELPFVGGSMTVFINGKPFIKEISGEYLNNHYDPASDMVYINREDFPHMLLFRNKCCCLCRRNVKIQLKYNAGYTSIPSGLLPLICPLMSKIEESKSGLNECANAMTQVAGALKFKKVGNIQYEWTDSNHDNQKTRVLYTDLFNLATVDEIYAISRCLIAETPEEMGCVV